MHESATLGTLRAFFQHLALGDRHAALSTLAGARQFHADEALLRHAAQILTRQPDPSDESALAQILQGWRAYYEARYAEAADHFLLAWTHAAGPEASWASWAALGAGKVASDLGHWATARDWLLASLALARREHDLPRLAEAHGALAEVLLRAGYPDEAFEYFTIDQRLLPVGSSDRNRLENYRAISLSHMGHAALAEPILWASFHAECDPNPEGAWYALGSLHALALRQCDDALLERLAKLTNLPNSPPPPMVAGFMAVAHAGRKRRHGDLAAAREDLDQAREAFSAYYPVETLWVKGLAADLGGEPVLPAAWTALQARPAPTPPADLPCSLLDEHVRTLPLAMDRPFADLAAARGEAAWDLAIRFMT